MVKKDYKCINKCKFEDEEMKEKVGLDFTELAMKADFKFCPKCGSLYPATIKKIEAYFDIIQIQERLKKSIELLYSAHCESAIREAIIKLETKIQELANLYNLNGTKLIGEAFKYEIDKDDNITVRPRIEINSLSDITEINEHDGVKLMLMGFFKGIRNIYMHKSINAEIYYTLNIITQVSMFLTIIEGANLVDRIE